MSHVFPRNARAALPAIARGDGVYLFDADNKRYLDGSGGAAVSCLGHSNAAVCNAIKNQLDDIAFAHTSFFTSAAAETLADMLAQRAPGDINRVYFCCGGSEAIEAALKLARQYHVERGEPQRQHIISRRQSYHGNTLGALAIGGNKLRRQLYTPLLFENAHHISPCHPWRDAAPEESTEDYGKRVAMELEEKILALGAENVAAFVAETIVGATLGAVAATPNYFRDIRAICDRHGVLLILDEVMCGSGRTGTLFTCEQEGVVPDIVCIAKGLGGGVQPLGAMLCRAPLYDAIKDGSGAFQHGHTYHAHATACAAGIAVLHEFDKHDLLARVQEMGGRLEAALRQTLGGHPHVGDIRGRGLFWGVELVANRADKTPFDAAMHLHAKIKRAAFARGLMVYTLPGAADGIRGDHILLAPPYIIEEPHIDEITEKLSAAIADAIA